jgi:hypothetical protein
MLESLVTNPPDRAEGEEPSTPFTFEQVAALRAGELTAGQEEQLRMRMQQYPERARRMLAALDKVDAMFPEPANFDDPLELPSDIDDRMMEIIARERERFEAEDDPAQPGRDGQPAEGHRGVRPDNEGGNPPPGRV